MKDLNMPFHTIIPRLISFLVCFIIQEIINYFFFNFKKKIDILSNLKTDCNIVKKKSINNKKINENGIDAINNNNIIYILQKENKKY